MSEPTDWCRSFTRSLAGSSPWVFRERGSKPGLTRRDELLCRSWRFHRLLNDRSIVVQIIESPLVLGSQFVT